MSATENSLYVIGSEAQIQMVYQSYKFRVLFTSVGLLLEKSSINATVIKTQVTVTKYIQEKPVSTSVSQKLSVLSA